MQENYDKYIGEIIHSRIPIEWIRFNMYITSDIYKSIPMLVFRVKSFCPENMIKNLKYCIDNFCGKERWTMFKDPLSRKGNYIITISELEKLHWKCYLGQIQYNQKKYFGIDSYKRHCECAIQDIPMLAKNIEKNI